VGALSQKDVGDYLNTYFCSSYQKISNFTLTARGDKQGGNVASYFCTPEGRVLHVVVGPVSGAKLLSEARWVVETSKLVDMDSDGRFVNLQLIFRRAHQERLAKEHGLRLTPKQLPALEGWSASTPIDGPKARMWLNRSGDQQAKVHLLLAAYPVPKIGRVYGTVFEDILNQPISTAPVVRRG